MDSCISYLRNCIECMVTGVNLPQRCESLTFPSFCHCLPLFIFYHLPQKAASKIHLGCLASVISPSQACDTEIQIENVSVRFSWGSRPFRPLPFSIEILWGSGLSSPHRIDASVEDIQGGTGKVERVHFAYKYFLSHSFIHVCPQGVFYFRHSVNFWFFRDIVLSFLCPLTFVTLTANTNNLLSVLSMYIEYVTKNIWYQQKRK